MKATRTHAASGAAVLEEGLVVSAHGRHVVIECADGSRRIAHPKGKRNEAVVGDRVLWQQTADEGRIERVQPRQNLFYRQDDVRTKSFAANLDQLLIFLAAEPEFSERQLARALIAAEAQGIPVRIGLNKHDLTAAFERAWHRLEPYRHMGYGVLPLCLNGNSSIHSETGLEALWPWLQGRRTLVLGPSGSGKSTLINAVIPGAKAETNSISSALNSGRHTTTTTQLYWTDDTRTTAVLDSPGFHEFGFHHIKSRELGQWMPDLRPHLGTCRFPNCTHRHEPGCAIISSIENASSTFQISASRYEIYAQLFDELDGLRHWR